MDDELQSQQSILFHWQWNKKILGFALIFFPLMLSLGFWQLDRAEQKQAILTAQKLRMGVEAVDFASLVADADNQFTNVVVTDVANDERVFLVDNKVRHGRPGYEVLMPLKNSVGGSEQWLLVNRGWLAGGADRSVLPPVPVLEAGPISGYLYRSQGKGIVLKDQAWAKNEWPLVIQAIDIEKISAHLAVDIYPYLLRVVESSAIDYERSSEESAVLETGWQVVNALPEKSIAYAFQWFAMALALLILTVFANSNLAEILRTRKGDDQK